jgi:anti-sigma regulatory factor (Ser/Thr protein kinase)
MSLPIATSTLDPPEAGVRPDGDGPRRLSFDRLSSEDLFVWGAVGVRALATPAETERRLKFRSLPQAVGAARGVLREWECHFEPGLFYDLSLCVSELVTNRVQQGDPRGGEEMELIVRRRAELVRAEVIDPRPDVLVSQSLTEPLSDWGIFIVDRVADRWGVDRGEGTVVWCEIDLASDGRSRNAPPIGTTRSSVPA